MCYYFLFHNLKKYYVIVDKYWEKNLCISRDLKLKSPVLLTGVLIIIPLRHKSQLRNKPLSHSYFNPRVSEYNTILQYSNWEQPNKWVFCLYLLHTLTRSPTSINIEILYIDGHIDYKYWEKNLCLNRDLNLRSPVLRTGFLTIRPGADQSSKAAFGKSAFAKTCSNVLHFVKDMTGAHQSSKKQKYFRARFGTYNEQNSFC